MKRIRDYGIIGDCRSAALVSREGSIDWLCWPRFDSPSFFAALLDDAGGAWRIAPSKPFRTERRYVESTNVLETRFHTSEGTLLLVDLMPVASEEEKRSMLTPDHEILRIARCEQGEIEIETLFAPRPGYAGERVRMLSAGRLGVRVETRNGLLVLRTEMPLDGITDGMLRGRLRLRAGESSYFSLSYADQSQAILPPLGAWSERALARSIAWWQRWSERLSYDGPYRDAVLRSALVLRLLVYAPSGAVIAAPTTSLPERLRGDLNWDYRFCWLRDASLTVRALLGVGCGDEARAFVDWTLHATRLTRPELRILYDVYGNSPIRERVLEQFRGFADSRPVRIGNAAATQQQLDVYGEVIDAVSLIVRNGEALDRESRRMLSGFGGYVCDNWDTPDHGIWETRSAKSHNTHSRLMCWLALDRLLALHANGALPNVPAARFREQRDCIRRQIEARAWNERLDSYVSTLDGETLDASLLLLSWYGFEPPDSLRMRGTYARIREQLAARGSLLYRYGNRDSPGEGAFGICSFWAAEYLAMGGGSVAEATSTLHELVGYANDLGLFAEEIDPDTGEALGNFPQAFTHVGLINAALSLSQRLAREKAPDQMIGRRIDPAAHAEAHP